MSSKQLNYLTISKAGQHELIIKKSKFICSLARTKTVEEAQEFIEQISKKYHDATHNTYAYTLGLNDKTITKLKQVTMVNLQERLEFQNLRLYN